MIHMALVLQGGTLPSICLTNETLHTYLLFGLYRSFLSFPLKDYLIDKKWFLKTFLFSTYLQAYRSLLI